MSLEALSAAGGRAPALLEAARAVLPASAGAHVVGGAVRDAALGRDVVDLDVVVDGDPRQAARAAARAVGGTAFPLSNAWGAWRVHGPDGTHLDLVPRQGRDLDDDLSRRDLTVNAVAVPLHGGPVHDPHGGLADLRAGRLRAVRPGAFVADPLRVLRLARIAADLDACPDDDARAAAADAADRLDGTAGERLLEELRRALGGPRPLLAAGLLAELGVRGPLGAAPEDEAAARRRLEAVVRRTTADPPPPLVVAAATDAAGAAHDPGEALPPRPAAEDLPRALAGHLGQPLAAGLDRGTALRLLAWAAPPGAAGPFLRRVRAPSRVAALDRELRPAELPDPTDGDAVWRWLRHRREPVAALLAGDEAPGRARALLPLALAWGGGPRPAPLVRGDRLLELGVPAGPAVGAAQERIAAARFAGRVRTAADAEALVAAGDPPAGPGAR